jgi:predicted DNA-binding ribbon-helix-helix protein
MMDLTAQASLMSQPRQRILQRHHRRLSFRLEEIFWAQLESCAKEEGVKLADLVFTLTETLAETENRSSLLRAYSVDWLRKRLLQARLAASQVDLQLVLTACPAPCVIITQQRRLAAHNPAFASDVLRRLVPSTELRQAENIVRLTLSKPFESISNTVRTEAAGYTDCAVVFASGPEQMRFIGRFCLLNRRSNEGDPLLCFLNTPERLANPS